MNGTLPNGTLPRCNGVRSPRHSDPHVPYSRLLESAVQRAPARRAACLATTALMLILLFSHPGVRYHATESLQRVLGIGRSSSGSADFKVSNSKGLCRLEYSVATFDGKNAPVCSPQLCMGREKLKVLEAVSGPRRWTPFDESQYMNLYKGQNISGWLQAPQIEYVKAFTRKQHELGIFGAVGEIGVHHGKFLIPIVGSALAGEPAIAMDLFENQQSNLDKSGYGSKAALLRNLEICGIPENSIRLVGSNSMHLTASNFSQWGLPAFRLLSVDGGHTLEITLHDLMVASCVVHNGGLVVLDDFPNPNWIGVAEALMHFTYAQDRLVPFMHGYNKVWFATKSYVQQWQEFIAAEASVFACRDMHESRRTIAGHALCFTGPNG